MLVLPLLSLPPTKFVRFTKIRLVRFLLFLWTGASTPAPTTTRIIKDTTTPTNTTATAMGRWDAECFEAPYDGIVASDVLYLVLPFTPTRSASPHALYQFLARNAGELSLALDMSTARILRRPVQRARGGLASITTLTTNVNAAATIHPCCCSLSLRRTTSFPSGLIVAPDSYPNNRFYQGGSRAS